MSSENVTVTLLIKKDYAFVTVVLPYFHYCQTVLFILRRGFIENTRADCIRCKCAIFFYNIIYIVHTVFFHKLFIFKLQIVYKYHHFFIEVGFYWY